MQPIELYTIIEKGIQTIILELNTPESHKKGKTFEEYARKYFPANHYTLVDKPHPFTPNKQDIPESSKNPDFRFRDKRSQREFYVEVKFRGNLRFDKICWTYSKQKLHYENCSKEIPVFIFLGFGNTPSNPDQIFLFNLDKIKYVGLYPSQLNAFRLQKDVVICPEKLWSAA